MRFGGVPLRALLRRWWLILLSAVVVTAVAVLLERPGPTTYMAESVLVVRSGATANQPGSANEANRLAVTYSALLPADSQVIDSVARTLGVDNRNVEQAVAVSNDTNTAILRIRYTADRPQVAIDGARAYAGAAAGSSPVTSNFNGLGIVRQPDSATAISGGMAVIPVAALLGLGLGLVLALAWERSTGRIESVDDVGRLVDCPVSQLDSISGPAIVALLERWKAMAGDGPVEVAVVPAAANLQSLAAEVASVFAETASSGLDARGHEDYLRLKGLTLVSTGAPATAEVGEAIIQRCQLTVLVIPLGLSEERVEATARMMKGFGAAPDWVLLAGDRVVRKARRSRPQGESVAVEVAPAPPPLNP